MVRLLCAQHFGSRWNILYNRRELDCFGSDHEDERGINLVD